MPALQCSNIKHLIVKIVSCCLIFFEMEVAWLFVIIILTVIYISVSLLSQSQLTCNSKYLTYGT